MRELYEKYCLCRKQYMIEGSPIPCSFKTEIDLDEKSPVENGLNSFSDLIYQGETDSESVRSAKALMRVLYSDEEYKMKISDGFFDRPNVGSAVFAANMDKILERFLEKIVNDRKDLKKLRYL